MKLKLIMILLSLCFSYSLQAASIVYQANQGTHPQLSLDGSSWTQITGLMNNRHNMVQVNDFSNLGTSGFDGIWVNQERFATFTDTEINNVRNFIAAGHRAVIIGENHGGFSDWVSKVMQLVGGALGNTTCLSESHAAVASHPLTDGVSSITSGCTGSLHSTTGSPQILFQDNVAGVYQVGEGEALVIMDSNIMDDARLNTTFGINISNWLEESANNSNSAAVPEPNYLGILLATGILFWYKSR